MDTKTLVAEAEKVAKELIANPLLKEYKPVIARKISALKANPTTRAAVEVISDLILIAEKVA
jgi:hypothetical protein